MPFKHDAIVAALLATGEPGSTHIEISSDAGLANLIRFFSGQPTELAPGQIAVDAITGDLTLFGAQLGALPLPSHLGLGGSSGQAILAGYGAASVLSSTDHVSLAGTEVLVNAERAATSHLGNTVLGAPPAAFNPMIQAGSDVAASNGAGDFTINFPTAFANAVAMALCVNGDVAVAGNLLMPQKSVTLASATFRLIASNTGAAILGSGAFRANWLAIGC